ncbi:hypothetical protein FXV91_18935 [Methanosarcina sp. DH2]|uniref:hypothetical protein n=1 Tax=Methanosarcina sp. DH2 TaxID=2605639 RepID=UPI001E6471AB|nr:hypothetical protein [Methanosarcina sp. DH2]MCC4772162.1 hypothetical protein [Methanosarcina sp. DH2]
MLNPSGSPLERSEKDLGLPKRNSGSETREAKLGKRNSGSETREAKLGKRNSGSETREVKIGQTSLCIFYSKTSTM